MKEISRILCPTTYYLYDLKSKIHRIIEFEGKFEIYYKVFVNYKALNK